MEDQLGRQGDPYADRHIGSGQAARVRMLLYLSIAAASYQKMLADFIGRCIPGDIRTTRSLNLPKSVSEAEVSRRALALGKKNRVWRTYIGLGYYGVLTVAVVIEQLFSTWFVSAYTPYQAAISQGRLWLLYQFQKMVQSLTGMDIANASLLDEASAAAEAMRMMYRIQNSEKKVKANGGWIVRNLFFVSSACHPQTIAVLRQHAAQIGIELHVGEWATVKLNRKYFGALIQYPNTFGSIHDYARFCATSRSVGTLVAVAADLLSLAVLKEPGAFGADIVLGSAQRFGVPIGAGGPHAAFLACRMEFLREMPGRVIWKTKDSHGKRAYYMALTTREQHIRREKATSNICTAQVLLAMIAVLWAMWHGPEGIRRIANEVHAYTRMFAYALRESGYTLAGDAFFDTLRISVTPARLRQIRKRAERKKINLWYDGQHSCVQVSFDETVTERDFLDLLWIFECQLDLGTWKRKKLIQMLADQAPTGIPESLQRQTKFLAGAGFGAFNQYHTESGISRLFTILALMDIAMGRGPIMLGSCTMKWNPRVTLDMIKRPEFANIHPFAPPDQMQGYLKLFQEFAEWLGEITGLPGVSLQPNSGATGEYTGFSIIKCALANSRQTNRTKVVYPSSAHGTNPASIKMAGFEPFEVPCDERGEVSPKAMTKFIAAHCTSKGGLLGDQLAGMAITYPSTFGKFERSIRGLIAVVKGCGGYVYLDGANLQSIVGYVRPGEIGVDIMHVNPHKTFATPHGGGGPGCGPVCMKNELAKYRPGHPLVAGVGGEHGIDPVAAAPWGSGSLYLINWMFIQLMGGDGLTEETAISLLNANYMAERLRRADFTLLHTGEGGYVAHELIVDFTDLLAGTGLKISHVANRLMDYGYHPPTMSFPHTESGATFMFEPAASESIEELDAMCDALIAIRAEIVQVKEEDFLAEAERRERADNPLKHAPHTEGLLSGDEWPHSYPRSVARASGFWDKREDSRPKYYAPVGSVHVSLGDRELNALCAAAGKQPISWTAQWGGSSKSTVAELVG